MKTKLIYFKTLMLLIIEKAIPNRCYSTKWESVLLTPAVGKIPTLDQQFATRGDFAPQGIFGNVWKYMVVTTRRALLASSGQRPEMLLNILQGCILQDSPPQQRIFQPLKIKSVEVKKSWPGQTESHF